MQTRTMVLAGCILALGSVLRSEAACPGDVCANWDQANGAFQAALAAGRNELYVTIRGQDKVDIYDTGTGGVIDSIQLPAGSYPLGVAITPDEQKALVCGSAHGGGPNGNRVYVIDLVTHELRTINHEILQPVNVVINSTGTRAYVTAFSSGRVVVIDVDSETVIQEVVVSSNAVWGIAIDPEDGFICLPTDVERVDWFPLDEGGYIVGEGVHACTGIPGINSNQNHGMVISPDSACAYICAHAGDNFVVKLRLGDCTFSLITVGDRPSGISYSRAIGRYFVTNHFSNTVSVIGWDDVVECTIPVHNTPEHPAVDPAGERVYVPHSDDAQLSVLCFDTSAMCREGTVTDSGAVVPTLFVNGSAGDSNHRVLQQEGLPVHGAMQLPPAGGNGKFVVHANLGEPTADSVAVLPFHVGLSCFDFLLPPAGGGEPIAVWNNLGKFPVLGDSFYFDGTPLPVPPRAPVTFLDLPAGDPWNLPAGTVVTLQGIVIDVGSSAVKPASVTNAVILEIIE